MPNNYKKWVSGNLVVLLGGFFLVYLAVLDDSLFNFIINNTPQNQFSVALATTIAAGLPMFFAVGFIKKTILRHWHTIHFYEKLVQREIYWILTVVLLSTVTYIIVTEEGIHQFNFPIFYGCILFSVYLMIHSVTTNKKTKHKKFQIF